MVQKYGNKFIVLFLAGQFSPTIKFYIMAEILSVAIVAPVVLGFRVGTVGLNVDNIQGIQVRTADAVSTGISEIIYTVNSKNGNYKRTISLYSSVAAATLITNSNA